MTGKKSADFVGTTEKATEDKIGITMVGAINIALARALEEDERVVIYGEDVGRNGGVFRFTDGLQKRFGVRRVFDSSLAESGIVGTAVGMATGGIKPVVEVQFMGFVYPGFDQFLSHAVRMRNRTQSRLSVPMTMMMPYGGGIHAPEHHSESTEALFAHLPGCRVVIPSTPKRAYRLLLAAIRDPDPVVFLIPKRIRLIEKEEIEDNGEVLPLDTSFVEREGNNITLISWGAMMKETREAADELAREGVSAEVIDVATLGCTFDMGSILSSLEKTGRCVIVHEATKTGGFGAEIAARIAEEGVFSLIAPVKRVTAPDMIVPLPQLEQHFLPSTGEIIAAVHEVMAFA